LVTKEVAKAKKPVFAAKYHSLSQTCDKRIVSCYSKQGSNLESYSHWQLLLYPRSIILALLSSSHNLKNSVGIVKWKNERLNQGIVTQLLKDQVSLCLINIKRTRSGIYENHKIWASRVC